MNFELVLLITTAIFISLYIYNKNEISSQYKEIQKLTSHNKELISKNEKIDFNYAKTTMDFLDRVIQDKFDYHLYNNILPIYLDKKIPEKKVISSIKEKIYVSVVGGLTPEVKKSILNIFTEKGIEIYINEKIMVLLNRTDYRATNSTKNTIDRMSDRDISKIIP